MQVQKRKKIPAYKKILVEEYWKVQDDQFGKIVDEILEDVKKRRVRTN